MSLVSDLAKSSRADDVDRNLALLAYGLLFFAVIFPGIPALIAVLIAYARRREVDPFIARHHRFQIFVFWVAAALMLAAAISALAASVWMAAEVVEAAVRGSWRGWSVVTVPELRIDTTTFALFGLAGTLGALTSLWLLVTSGYGFVRLASRRDIHHTAP